MKINLKVRFKNKCFWIAFIPAIVLWLKQILDCFGISINETQLTDILESSCVVLTLLGVINDPTTQGFSDSTQALNYEIPKEEIK